MRLAGPHEKRLLCIPYPPKHNGHDADPAGRRCDGRSEPQQLSDMANVAQGLPGPSTHPEHFSGSIAFQQERMYDLVPSYCSRVRWHSDNQNFPELDRILLKRMTVWLHIPQSGYVPSTPVTESGLAHTAAKAL